MSTKFTLVVLIVLFMLSLIGLIYAGTTGKITGVIIDEQSKEPLPGANVMIENSSMGAATDHQGQFIIINVPPGNYNLKVSMMGYQSVVIEAVRVRIDLTTTVNTSLSQTVLHAGEVVTVQAERPLVQMDMTSSLSAVGANEIENLPVQEISDVIELQAGIVEADGLHIRGGRAGEVAYWVDGVATTDVYNGDMGVTVENSAVQELQIISGTFNAEYGQAMSGIINIITKEGGSKYSGQIKAYVGDYIAGGDEFNILERVDVDENPQTGERKAIGKEENPLKKLNPTYNVEFSLDGPIPGLGEKLNFFLNGRYFSDEGWLYGREWYTPQGLAGDSSLVPLNPIEKYSALAKLTFRPISNLKLNYDLFVNNYQRDKTYNHAFKYNPNGTPLQKGNGTTHILTLNHVLSPSTFYELKVSRFYNEYEQYVYDDPTVFPHFLVRVTGDPEKGIYEFDPSTPGGEVQLQQIKADRIPFIYVVDPAQSTGYVHPDSALKPVSYSFLKSGMDMNHKYRSTSYYVGKFDLTSQLNKSHQVKAGFEFRQYELSLEQFTLRPKLKAGASEQIIPFQPNKEDISTIYTNEYNQKPREFSAYFQDKMEFKDIILNLGLRFDYFDANGYIPTDPTDPNIYYPFRSENIYKNPDAPEAERLSYTAEERRAFMHKKVSAKKQISPRLGIAYPITDRGVIHFSYGHFFQIPEFQYLYENPDYKVTLGSGNRIFGNPDLNPQKTVMYEIGLQQQLTENIGIDLTLFYRDVRDWIGTSPLVATVMPGVKYALYENKDYSNVRGITFKLEKRYTNNILARLDYSFQIAEGTYSNPIDAFNAYAANEEPRRALIPLDWDQNHTLNAQVTYYNSKWTVSMIGKYYSGMPYTPGYGRNQIVGGSALVGFKENSERLPTINSFDVHINRRIEVGALEFNLFCYIYNLFNQKGEKSVYADTGTASYTTNIDPDYVSFSLNRVGTVEDFVRNSNWYVAPRQIQAGLIIGF